MSKHLFNEFSEVSAKQWKQYIQTELKGADYNETLVWKTMEGIDVKPFYHQDDLNFFTNIPQTKASQFTISQHIYADNSKKANLKAVNAIKKGAESIVFTIPDTTISIVELLKNITSPIYLDVKFLSENYFSPLKEINKNNIYLNADIIGNLAASGNWYYNLNKDFSILNTLIQEHSKHTNALIGINTSLYQNAGANMVQQLAYTLAHANEYLNYFGSTIVNHIYFKVSVGSNYFFEIAKLRALQWLWQILALEYTSNPKACHILAYPTKRNKTLYDYNVNMLRTTTECMSAILGGAKSICNIPYDIVYHKNNEFGERIARNQLLILKHESYFNLVNNPADGSYYIETLTQQLAEKALALFKQIEAGKGFLKMLKENTIQKKIKESADVEQEAFNTHKEILVGTNKYPNTDDFIKNELELYPFVKTRARKTLIEPIIERRLAEPLEKKRLENE